MTVGAERGGAKLPTSRNRAEFTHWKRKPKIVVPKEEEKGRREDDEDDQCDKIGRFLKVLGWQILSSKSSPNIGFLGYFLKSITFR